MFVESPIELISGFLSHSQFSVFLEEAMTEVPVDADEQARRDAIAAAIKILKADRTNLIEIEARRVMLMTDKTPETMLRRLGEDLRFAASQGLNAQRDAIARSLWAYLETYPLFEAAERAMQVRVYRDHGKIYEAWSLDASIPLVAQGVNHEALSAEIADRLQHEDGCKVEAIDLPAENGESQDVLVAVTFFGAYASQKTVRPDKSTEILYFRPPDEMLLVYSQTRRRIEVCSRDMVERKLVANIFAADTLKHDVSNKPLTQKTYNLSRFKSSLKLPIPDEEAHRVRRANITEVQVALGGWSRKVSLSVTPEDDIDAIARAVFGAIIPSSGGGYVTKVRFHIEYIDGRGRKGTLQFDVFGRNKSNIQSERDPAKRELGYDLLEAWGVLERIGDLSKPQRKEKLPQLLALYDFTDEKASGQTLDELGIGAAELTGAGFLTRKGWSNVVLFDDDELGDVVRDVEGNSTGDAATLTLIEGGAGPRIPVEDITQYEIRFDYLRDALRDVLKPMGLKGRVREVANHVHQIGSAQIGLASASIYLARALSDDKLLEGADRLIRGEGNRIRGVVFVPQEIRFPYIGCNVVLSLKDHIDKETGLIDPEAVRSAYEAAIDPAARGTAVHLRKQGDDAAQITVPGQDPRIVTGAKKVKLFERLYIAHHDREPGVKLAALKEYAGFSQLPQLFGDEWGEINGRYLYSPQRAYWALCGEPISV
ncbi:hypothetical protein CDQ91_19480 [Sphingopyxis witflariensis]|uniref:Uncharacterized protein n=1 Tax=Sphingopyxis witflariensis TaxID=173675 RepID=A0A246JF24_9SPHN|nr:hypothetical protein CDQ91_19480 [Sphingopyxis witflariensis]